MLPGHGVTILSVRLKKSNELQKQNQKQNTFNKKSDESVKQLLIKHKILSETYPSSFKVIYFGSISRPTCSIAFSYSYLEHFPVWWNDMYVHPATMANEVIDNVHRKPIFIWIWKPRNEDRDSNMERHQCLAQPWNVCYLLTSSMKNTPKSIATSINMFG